MVDKVRVSHQGLPDRALDGLTCSVKLFRYYRTRGLDRCYPPPLFLFSFSTLNTSRPCLVLIHFPQAISQPCIGRWSDRKISSRWPQEFLAQEDLGCPIAEILRWCVCFGINKVQLVTNPPLDLQFASTGLYYNKPNAHQKLYARNFAENMCSRDFTTSANLIVLDTNSLNMNKSMEALFDIASYCKQ